jgi:hypothetical protein
MCVFIDFLLLTILQLDLVDLLLEFVDLLF